MQNLKKGEHFEYVSVDTGMILLKLVSKELYVRIYGTSQGQVAGFVNTEMNLQVPQNAENLTIQTTTSFAIGAEPHGAIYFRLPPRCLRDQLSSVILSGVVW